MRGEIKKILSQVFVGLTIFLIVVHAFKSSNPYAYPGIETRVLFILVPIGVVFLYIYLCEGDNRLSSRISSVVGEVRYRRYMRFCQIRWQTITPLISYAFLGLLLILAVESIAPEPLKGWERTPLMVATVALGAITFYLNRDELDEIEEEARQEEIEEKRREMEFAEKYPRVNRVRGVRWVATWMYKEGGWYTLGLIFIALLFLFIRIIIMGTISADVDEGYTYAVNEGYLKYGELSTTITGVTYPRSPVYNFFNSVVYVLTNNSILSLKLFNILFFFFTTPFIYLSLKNLFNKKISFLSISLINLNWYINAIILAGRSYIFAIIFSFFALYYIIKCFDSNISASKYLKQISLAILFMILGFFEGHILVAYQLIPLLFVSTIYSVLKNKNTFNLKRKLIIIIPSISFFVFISVYILFLKPTFAKFILSVFETSINFRMLDELGSIISHISILGILIILIILCKSFFIKRTNNISIFILNIAFFITYIYLIHGIFFSARTKYFFYFFGLIIPMIVLLSVWLYNLFLNGRKKLKKIIMLMILVVFISTSAYNLFQISQEKVSWSMNGRPIKSMVGLIPENAIILTDIYLPIKILRPNAEIYTTFRWVDDPEAADINLLLDNENERNLRNFSDIEKERFNNYIEKEIRPNYIISNNNQLYMIYSGYPMIMDTNHLLQVLNKKGEVYLIYTHTAYDNRAKRRNPELYNFIFKNIEIIKEHDVFKNNFNDQTTTSNLHKYLTVAKLSNK